MKKNSFGENLLFIQLTMTHKFELLESEKCFSLESFIFALLNFFSGLDD